MGARVIVASLGGVLVACGGQAIGADGDAGGVSATVTRTTVTGTVGGIAVSATDTISFVQPLVGTFGPFTSNGVVVSISNVDGLCALAQSHASPANSVWLKVVVASPDAVVAGTYAISTSLTFTATSHIGILTFVRSDAGCSAATKIYSARSGSIVLAAVSSTTVEGTFSVTMDTGEALSGTFSAPVCDASSDAGTHACGV